MDLIAVVIGMLIHHVKVLVEINAKTGQMWTPRRYYRERKWAFWLSILCSVAGTIIVISIFTPLIAIDFAGFDDRRTVYYGTLLAVGIGGDAVADWITSKYKL